MRVAALYDIHGNLPALEAVLADVRRAGADRVVVGGDVLPGPMPRETLDCLLAVREPVDFIRGNGEAAVLAHLAGADLRSLPERAREAVQWVAAELRPADVEVVSRWATTLRVAIPGLGSVLFCHATPRSDSEIFTRETPEDALVTAFRDLDAPVVVCGHTHMPFERRVGGTLVLNAGSVGMPFGDPVACWALLGPEIVLRQTTYDLPAAAARIRATRYPGAGDFARRCVLQPPTEAEMLEVYSKVEVGTDRNARTTVSGRQPDEGASGRTNPRAG
jgi:predicted phosphodiesterase